MTSGNLQHYMYSSFVNKQMMNNNTNNHYSYLHLQDDLGNSFVLLIQRDLHYYIIDFIYSNLLNSKFSDDNSLILDGTEESLNEQ